MGERLSVATSDSRLAGRPELSTDVLIVGAGPVGLSLAMELAQRGVGAMIIDPRTEVVPFRKANGCNARTFEHFRRWGVADEIRTRAPLPKGWSDDILFVTSMTGKTLAHLSDVKHGRDGGDVSPEAYQRVPQWLIETVLREQVEASESIETLWGERLLAHEEISVESERPIRALIGHDGDTKLVESRFIVGCDGTRSQVRRDLGIAREQRRTYSKNLNVTFRSSELATMHGKPPAVHYWYLNPDVSGHISPQDLAGTWLLTSTWLDEEREPDPTALVQRALGEGIRFEVLESSEWWANSYLAESYRKGASFICGDAAHVHPPTGGYGMNQGIHDAVDLGWKLAGVLQGWAADGILDAYEAERRPVNQIIVNEASDNWINAGRKLASEGMEEDTERGRAARARLEEEIPNSRARQFDALGLILGYRYLDSPLVTPDRTPEEPLQVERYLPSARPGHRAPHAWLADGRSLFDEFGQDFTLLDLGAEPDHVGAFLAAAKAAGVPMTELQVADPDVAQLYESTLVLIRPDQHVAWRDDGHGASTSPSEVLARATGHCVPPQA